MKLKLIAAATGLALSGAALADSGSIYQYGNDNFAYIDQTASGAYASVYQSGDRNHAGQSYTYDYTTYYYPGIYQNNVVSGYAYVDQWGNDNWATVWQQNGTNLQAYVAQGGWFYDDQKQESFSSQAFSSYASVSQYENTDVHANVYQGGSNNYAYVSQGYGSSNTAVIAQMGDNHSAGIGQYSGSGNTARIVQR